MKDFISYIDEHDQKKENVVTIIETNSSFVKFQTLNNNLITIPMSRVLKIKEREDTP